MPNSRLTTAILATLMLAGCANTLRASNLVQSNEIEAPILFEADIQSLLGETPEAVADALKYSPNSQLLTLQYAAQNEDRVFEVYTPRYVAGGPLSSRFLGDQPLTIYSPLGFVFEDGGLSAVTYGHIGPKSNTQPGRLPFAETDFGATLAEQIEELTVAPDTPFILRGTVPRETSLQDDLDGLLTGVTFGVFALPLAAVSLPIVAVGEVVDQPIEEAAAKERATADTAILRIEIGKPLPNLDVEMKEMPQKLFSPRGPRAYADLETDFQIYVFGPTNGEQYHIGVRNGLVEWMTGPMEGWLRSSMCLSAQPAYGSGFFGLNCSRNGRDFRY